MFPNLLLRSLHVLALFCALAGCQQKPSAKLEQVAHHTIEATVASVISGEVRAEKVAELAFGAVGRVQRLPIEVGDHVEKGQVLAELENDDLRVRYETERREYERRAALGARKLISPSEVDQARSSADIALGVYNKTLVVAPFNGVIAELNLEVGQLSQITAVMPKALIRIVDLEPRYVRAEIDEVDLPRLALGQAARVQILAVRREPFQAKLRKIVPYVSSMREQDRTTQVELEVESEGVLLPVGASADVEVVVDRKEGVLSVPSKTVLGRTGARYLYRWSAGIAQRVPVEVGILNFDRTEIVKGLREGDFVVVPNDTLELADGVAVNASPSE